MRRVMRVLLVEDDRELCEKFSKYFAGIEGIELVETTDSATRAIQLVREMQPDAVVLDLELHMGEGNGISFLSKIIKDRKIKKPYIVVNTNNSSRTTYEIVRKLGADFVMFKHQQGNGPAEIADFLLAIFSDGAETQTRCAYPTQSNALPDSHELRERIIDELNKVCISPKSKGYLYLADAIEICCGGYVPNVSAMVGEKYGKTCKSVERAMQNAIDRAWDTSDINELLKHYTARINSAKRISPTVMEFIGFYAAKLRNDS